MCVCLSLIGIMEEEIREVLAPRRRSRRKKRKKKKKMERGKMWLLATKKGVGLVMMADGTHLVVVVLQCAIIDDLTSSLMMMVPVGRRMQCSTCSHLDLVAAAAHPSTRRAFSAFAIFFPIFFHILNITPNGMDGGHNNNNNDEWQKIFYAANGWMGHV